MDIEGQQVPLAKGEAEGHQVPLRASHAQRVRNYTRKELVALMVYSSRVQTDKGLEARGPGMRRTKEDQKRSIDLCAKQKRKKVPPDIPALKERAASTHTCCFHTLSNVAQLKPMFLTQNC